MVKYLIDANLPYHFSFWNTKLSEMYDFFSKHWEKVILLSENHKHCECFF